MVSPGGELRAELRGEMGQLRSELNLETDRLHNRTLLGLAALISAATAALALLG